MMPKYIFTFLLFLLQGCQLQGLKATPTQSGDCQITTQQLFIMQSKEKRFLNSKEARSTLLQNAIQEKNRPLMALLMSSPYASTEQLRQAKRHYSKLRLNPQQHCPGDQYLNLRNQQTSALLWLRAEQDKLETQNSVLQTKIDALTQIESDLNQQREGK